MPSQDKHPLGEVTAVVGIAFVAQLTVLVVACMLVGPGATQAALYAYYPICLLVALAGVGSTLSDPVFFAVWLPGLGMTAYSGAVAMARAVWHWHRMRKWVLDPKRRERIGDVPL